MVFGVGGEWGVLVLRGSGARKRSDARVFVPGAQAAGAVEPVCAGVSSPALYDRP